MRVIAVIPARGGSKSIPRKNIKAFCGKALIAHSIEHAMQARCLDRIIVSTDDEEIAEVARRYGAEVPFIRPRELAEDDTTDFPVFWHAYQLLARELSPEDIMVQLRPTAPVRPDGLVDLATDAFLDSDADSLRSVSVAEPTPYKMWRKQGDYIEPLLDIGVPESYNLPRQKLPMAYWHNGLIDIFRINTLIEQRSLTGKKILPYEIDRKYCFDLDTELQWAYAEYMYERMWG